MELICRIIEQHPLQQRQYTDRQGQPQVFTSMGFTLASGTDTLYAELTGEDAMAQAGQQPASKDYYYKLNLSARAESWDAQDGSRRHGTRIYINKLSVL